VQHGARSKLQKHFGLIFGRPALVAINLADGTETVHAALAREKSRECRVLIKEIPCSSACGISKVIGMSGTTHAASGHTTLPAQ
jgi:hypothetical protein